MTQNHPIPRFAAVILSGAYRQCSGHQAGLAGAAQADLQQTLNLRRGSRSSCPRPWENARWEVDDALCLAAMAVEAPVNRLARLA
jgi:hypothetical protein